MVFPILTLNIDFAIECDPAEGSQDTSVSRWYLPLFLGIHILPITWAYGFIALPFKVKALNLL